MGKTIWMTIAGCALCALGASAGDELELVKELDRLHTPAVEELTVDEHDSKLRDCGIIISARENSPRLVLNTGGPVSAVKDLAFSPDSQRLYAGGNDKTVQVWGIQASARGIRRTALNRAVLAQTLRWDLSRGPRGVVYAIAADPTSREVAMAGYSSWTRPWGDAGDIVVYDSARGQVVRVLEGHAQTVVDVDYSPDGKWVASRSSDGEVRVWNAPNWQPKVLVERADATPLSPQPIGFISDTTLAVAKSVNAERTGWQVELYDLSQDTPRPVLLPQLHLYRLTALERGPAGAWATADIAGNVFLWQGDQQPQPTLLRKSRVAGDLAFTPDGNLFISTLLQNGQAVIEYWDTKTKEMIDQVETSSSEHNMACAVSPDGTRVATCGENNQVWIFLLHDRDGNPLPQPLSKGYLLRLKGTGKKVYKVAFAKEGYRLGIGTALKSPSSFNNYADVEASFDLAKRAYLTDGAQDWKSPGDGAAGWTVARDKTGQILQIQGSNQISAKVTLDNESQGRAQSYCWIPGDNGKPFGLAVGTDKQQGVFVYGLPDGGGECPLLRYYRDHNDRVTSISISADGKYLASGSEDQTIKVWSLEGIRAQDPAEAVWGGRFAIADGKVTLQNAVEGGAATRKGIRLGDAVVEAKFDRHTAVRLGKPKAEYTTRDPQEILDGLRLTHPASDLLLTLERSGKRLNRQVLLKPAWEPLMTLFIDNNNEWALWTPQGFYDSSVSGDELFGWQLNRGIHNTPDFYRADQFRGSLERPRLMDKLLEAGNLRDAIRLSGVSLGSEPDDALVQNLTRAPAVNIAQPADGEHIRGGNIPVVARVRYPSPEVAEAASVRAFVNGVPGQEPVVTGVGEERTYSWEVPSSDYYNRVRVAVEGVAPERLSQYSDVHFSAEATRQERPKMHVLAIAASEYAGGIFPPLDFPVIDAQSILDELTTRSQGLYEPGVVRNMVNERVSPRTVQDAINALKRELKTSRPDDLLVVFMAGHGFAFEHDYYFVPPHQRFAKTSVGPELETDLKELGIAWSQLLQLGALPCRKVFMLDTCYAGNVLLRQNPADHWKEAIRPLKRDQIVVISATDVNQAAVEAAALGHGVFTKCLLDGFGGDADVGKDGQVDLREISDYVVNQVPLITRQFQAQTPRVSPTDLIDYISVPIVKYQQHAGTSQPIQ